MSEILQALKKRYHFDEWRERRTMKENLFVWRTMIGGNEISGWQPMRIRAVPPAESIAAAAPAFQQRSTITSSFWQRRRGVLEPLLSMEAYECRSQSEAREVTVQLLGEFDSGLMVWLPQSTIGDVAFSGAHHQVFLFTRANMVIMLRNATYNFVPLDEPAQQYDRFLVARPESVEGAGGASLGEVQLQQADRGLNIRLATKDLERSTMYKFFSTTGEIHEEDGELVYLPRVEGEQTIAAYGASPDSSRQRQLSFTL